VESKVMRIKKHLRQWQKTIPASLFVALESLSAAPAIAGDGVVILQREVPVRPAIREGNPGRALTIDTSPDDKVQQAVSQSTSVKPTELNDADFAAISTGTPRALGVASDTAGLSETTFNSYGLGNAGSAGTVQSVTPMIAGPVGGAVGAATGQLNTGLTGATNAMTGLTSAIMRTTGQ